MSRRPSCIIGVLETMLQGIYLNGGHFSKACVDFPGIQSHRYGAGINHCGCIGLPFRSYLLPSIPVADIPCPYWEMVFCAERAVHTSMNRVVKNSFFIMGQRYNKNAKTGDCGFQKVALEVSEVKLRKKKQAANCIPFCKCTGSLQDRSMLPVRNQTSLMMSIPMRMASSFIGIR